MRTYRQALAHFNRQDKATQFSILVCFQSMNKPNEDGKLTEAGKEFRKAVEISQSWAERWPNRYSNVKGKK